MQEERQKRREEQLAKEEAAQVSLCVSVCGRGGECDLVQERRRSLEAERAARLEEQEQRRRMHVGHLFSPSLFHLSVCLPLQDAKVEQMRLERERVRERSAQKKARCILRPLSP